MLAHLWNHGVFPQAPPFWLSELLRSCGLDLDCFRIVILLLHTRQGAVFGCEGFDCADQVALSDDAACDFFTLGGEGWI